MEQLVITVLALAALVQGGGTRQDLRSRSHGSLRSLVRDVDSTATAATRPRSSTCAMAQYGGPPQTPPGEIPDDRPDVRRRVESFEKLVKDPEKDADAVSMLDGMITMFKDSAARDRGRILKSMVTSVKVTDVPKDKTKPRLLPAAAAERMSQMGAEAIKPITDLLLDARVGKEMARVTPLATGLVKLGIGTVEAFDTCLKLLEDPNPRLYVGLVPAFATMDLETQPKRKRIAAAVLAAHESFAVRVDKDKLILAEEKPKFTENGKIGTITTLNALAVQKQPDVAAFKAWFAENKAKEWPEK